MDKWYKDHAEVTSKKHKVWRLNHLAKRAYDASAYRTKQINATPNWLTKDHWILMDMEYQKARYLTDVTGIEWEVDHIIPIQGKNVQGLHVPWNLRVITAVENMSKGNRIK
jgi:5-methylcytosine-specific restriction endonuclease McrA